MCKWASEQKNAMKWVIPLRLLWLQKHLWTTGCDVKKNRAKFMPLPLLLSFYFIVYYILNFTMLTMSTLFTLSALSPLSTSSTIWTMPLLSTRFNIVNMGSQEISRDTMKLWNDKIVNLFQKCLERTSNASIRTIFGIVFNSSHLDWTVSGNRYITVFFQPCK